MVKMIIILCFVGGSTLICVPRKWIGLVIIALARPKVKLDMSSAWLSDLSHLCGHKHAFTMRLVSCILWTNFGVVSLWWLCLVACGVLSENCVSDTSGFQLTLFLILDRHMTNRYQSVCQGCFRWSLSELCQIRFLRLKSQGGSSRCTHASFLQHCCSTIFHHAAFPTIASKLQVCLQVLYLPERRQGSEECLHLLCCHSSELYQASNPGAFETTPAVTGSVLTATSVYSSIQLVQLGKFLTISWPVKFL